MNDLERHKTSHRYKAILKKHPIAYFCAEFAFEDDLPIFSGGLGVLAGDTVREASDQRIPMVAIGLFYHQGYFRQEIDPSEGQKEVYVDVDPQKAGLKLVQTEAGNTLYFHVPMKDRFVWFRAWEYKVGNVPVYLLDSDVIRNTAEDRTITQRLYGGDQEHRLKQEILLGIGGERLLFALDIHPSVYHLNEGHSALAIFEICYHLMKEFRLTFDEAFARAHQTIVFTNHTLVPAGNDIFPAALVKEYLSVYAKELKIPLAKILARGKVPSKPDSFGMTMLSLNMSWKTNAVSKLHGQKAHDIWPNQNMIPITNGVHMPTWIAQNIRKATGDGDYEQLRALDLRSLWKLHRENKKRTLKKLNEITGSSFQPDVCTVVWARRFATYKRPGLLFEEIKTLKRIARSAHGALQIVIAGKAHPKDNAGKEILASITRAIEEQKLSDWVVFVPNYRLEIAKLLVSGADIWLNTPMRGQEASGTSGMKAGANGVLQFSISDGWVDEVDWADIGWILDEAEINRSLYNTLEREILPRYYTRFSDGFPESWVMRMKKTMKLVWRRFSTERMVGEYMKEMYEPSIDAAIGAHAI